eukprot:9385021-Prorocentrum_lima.AAC.1
MGSITSRDGATIRTPPAHGMASSSKSIAACRKSPMALAMAVRGNGNMVGAGPSSLVPTART